MKYKSGIARFLAAIPAMFAIWFGIAIYSMPYLGRYLAIAIFAIATIWIMTCVFAKETQHPK